MKLRAVRRMLMRASRPRAPPGRDRARPTRDLDLDLHLDLDLSLHLEHDLGLEISFSRLRIGDRARLAHARSHLGQLRRPALGKALPSRLIDQRQQSCALVVIGCRLGDRRKIGRDRFDFILLALHLVRLEKTLRAANHYLLARARALDNPAGRFVPAWIPHAARAARRDVGELNDAVRVRVGVELVDVNCTVAVEIGLRTIGRDLAEITVIPGQ